MRRRFRLIRQLDTNQCGAACLASVLNWFGRSENLSDVERQCHPTKEGISMLSLKKAAEFYNLETVVVKLSVEQLLEMPTPMILFWDQNHYVVLIKARANKYKIADPAKGIYKCTYRELSKHWLCIGNNTTITKGICMLLEPCNDFITSEKSYSIGRATLSLISNYLKSFRSIFIQILGGMIIGCFLQLLLPFLTQAIVDKGIKHADINIIWLILIGEILIVMGQAITNFVRGWLVLHVSVRIKISLISDFLIKLFKLPMSFFEKKKIGDTLQRISDHDRIQSFLTGQFLSATFSLFSVIVFGAVLLFYNRLVFCIFFIGSITYLIWITFFLEKRKQIDYETFGLFSKNQSKTFELISNIQEIKLHNCETRYRWKWEDIQADLFDVQVKSLKLKQAQESGSIIIQEFKKPAHYCNNRKCCG